jgi:hypothetical protein
MRSFGAVETVDGKMLLYTKRSSQGIWGMPPNGGAEARIWGGQDRGEPILRALLISVFPPELPPQA